MKKYREDIGEDQDKDSIIGIQAFHFKLAIIEDIYYLIMILLELWIIKMGLFKGSGFSFIVVFCFVLYIVLCLVCFFVCWVVVLFWVWNG